MFQRYAIFYTPPSGAFADFCASWLGWDSRSGLKTDHPKLRGLDVEVFTKTPRKYGIHGTLKAPFYLAKGYSPDDLIEAFRLFALTRSSVTLDKLSLQYHHGFLALRPTGDVSGLNALAADIVKNFDSFRAPLTKKDVDRRRKAGLTPQQDRNLLAWGYPYIFDDFHFHMTLSGKLDETAASAVMDALEPKIGPLLPDPFKIDSLSLMAQDSAGMFHQIHRYALTG